MDFTFLPSTSIQKLPAYHSSTRKAACGPMFLRNTKSCQTWIYLLTAAQTNINIKSICSKFRIIFGNENVGWVVTTCRMESNSDLIGNQWNIVWEKDGNRERLLQQRSGPPWRFGHGSRNTKWDAVQHCSRSVLLKVVSQTLKGKYVHFDIEKCIHPGNLGAL